MTGYWPPNVQANDIQVLAATIIKQQEIIEGLHKICEQLHAAMEAQARVNIVHSALLTMILNEKKTENIDTAVAESVEEGSD